MKGAAIMLLGVAATALIGLLAQGIVTYGRVGIIANDIQHIKERVDYFHGHGWAPPEGWSPPKG